jgi:hypothetical protein
MRLQGIVNSGLSCHSSLFSRLVFLFLLNLIVALPLVSCSMILSIPWSSHFHVTFLRTSGLVLGRNETHVIGFVTRSFFNCDVGSVQLAIQNLSSLVSMRSSSSWKNVFHETVVFFDIWLSLSITPHVNVFNWILLHEAEEGAERIDS